MCEELDWTGRQRVGTLGGLKIAFLQHKQEARGGHQRSDLAVLFLSE